MQRYIRSIAVTNTMGQKQIRGGQGLLLLIGYSPLLREVRSQTQAGTLRQKPLPLAHPKLMLSKLSYTVLTTSPGNSVTDLHSGLGIPTSINNQEHSPQVYPQACLIRASFQLWLPSQMALPCVKSTIYHFLWGGFRTWKMEELSSAHVPFHPPWTPSQPPF